MRYLVYETATGMIRRELSVVLLEDLAYNYNQQEESLLVLPDGFYVSGNVHYVVDQTVVDRPTLDFDKHEITADGVDTTSFMAVSGTTVTLAGVDYVLTADELVEFTSDEVKEFDYQINPPFPYQSVSGIITSGEAN